MKWRALEVRLLAFYCALLLVLGGAFSIFTVKSFGHFERATIGTDIAARATEIWAIGGSLIDQPAPLAELLERRFSPAAQNRFIRLSANGRVIYQSGRPAQNTFDPMAIPLPDAAALHGQSEFGDVYVVAREFALPDGRTIIVQSGQSSRFARENAANLISSLLFGLPVLLAFAALGGYFLIRQAWAPLDLMIRAAEAITFNDPHHRLPLTDTGDRINVLGQALNRMLDRLDHAYQHASRFSADAAHELRTPLAIIRGELDYLSAQPELSVESQDSIGSISEEARRLAEMTEHLLLMARMDSGWGKHEHAAVDLVALAAETIGQMHLLAEEKHITLRASAGPPAFVAGDRGRLKQVLVNLLDNAINYTTGGGVVNVDVQTHGDKLRLLVSDIGIGIPAEHLEDVFRRFFRVSTDRGQQGAGLGLAIARAICQAHGGTLSVRSVIGEGSQFCVELPLAQEKSPAE